MTKPSYTPPTTINYVIWYWDNFPTKRSHKSFEFLDKAIEWYEWLNNEFFGTYYEIQDMEGKVVVECNKGK